MTSEEYFKEILKGFCAIGIMLATIGLIALLSGCSVTLDPKTVKVIVTEESKKELHKVARYAVKLGFQAGVECVEKHDINFCKGVINND